MSSMEHKIAAARQLRERTGSGLYFCKKALENSGWDVDKAEVLLREMDEGLVAKLKNRTTSAGRIGVYKHHDSQKAGMVCLQCETDFVARTSEFIELAEKLAMQAVGMGCQDPESLLEMPLFEDSSSRTVKQAIADLSVKCGELIQLGHVRILKV